MSKRRYNKTLRADQEGETRQCIVDAALCLYGEIGPARTTISAVAERAEVQRLTIYRHFPAENELLAACLSHWLVSNPPPDPGSWRQGIDPADWGLAILSMLYHYYAETAEMWGHWYRDLDHVAPLREQIAGFTDYLETLCHDILESLPAERRQGKMCRSVVLHAVQFATWQSFSKAGIDNSEMAALMDDWLHKCPLS
ncbi:helix-turn-helix domain-containing protein [Thalassospira alkalitolerans]|mgnify:FL=1|uniref:TetR/AcrR family transcriptional regulator n=1 Tax=Thalassospira alkalitolerans TaxID=1293890 RepID=UPI0030ED1406|tara:strand:- start:6818 stop:7411 length:594 start_codon:yes stop_codon:yes gene_type:complete